MRVDLHRSSDLAGKANKPSRYVDCGRTVRTYQEKGLASLYPSGPADDPTAPSSICPRVESIRFTTFKAGSDRRSGGLTCRPTGEFEHGLVALANPAAAI